MQFPLGVYSWLGKSYGMAYGAQRYHGSIKPEFEYSTNFSISASEVNHELVYMILKITQVIHIQKKSGVQTLQPSSTFALACALRNVTQLSEQSRDPEKRQATTRLAHLEPYHLFPSHSPSRSFQIPRLQFPFNHSSRLLPLGVLLAPPPLSPVSRVAACLAPVANS